MAINTQTLFLFIFLTAKISLFAQAPVSEALVSSPTESEWKGFKRYDFKFDQREARLIIPNMALPGKPWIWRARFPDWHTEADSILVAEGFHLAYINTNGKFGSPKAVAIWDDYYDFLVAKYQLHKKVALMGVSRGGLFVYNWAKKNPENVACIYAEAPVCDFKSWPLGFGESEGNANSWTKLKNEYEFVSDAEAKSYLNNPIDDLETLAKTKVPILHMVSLKDKVVPVNENTLILINKYIKLGGNATVITCSKGVQKLNGHHFPIETPRLVADYIKYNSAPTTSLNASKYHKLGSGLKNSQLKFERDKTGRVAFLGGSITYNPGWRDSVSNYLIKRFPETKFEFIEAGIPSMGSTPAAFRLQRDVLSKGKVDLLFEEAAVNDATNGRSSEEQVRAMEGLVRHLRTSNSKMDIIMMHFVDPDKISTYNSGQEPLVIQNHNKVAANYKTPTINLAKEVTDRINNNEFNWKDDFKNLHPSPFGQGIYASSILHFLEKAYRIPIEKNDEIIPHTLPIKIDRQSYDNGHLIDISAAKLNKDWAIDSTWSPNDSAATRPNYTEVPMLVSRDFGSALKLKFKGSAVGIAVASGPDAGTIAYRIDKKEWLTLNLSTKWSKHLHLPWYYTLASDLESRKHVLEIRLTDINAAKSTNNPACRIRYFYAND